MSESIIIDATDHHGGNSYGTTYSVEADNSVFDSIASDLTGQHLSGSNYYVMGAGLEFPVFPAIPKGSTVTSAYITYYHNFAGTPSHTVYPYCYDLTWGTTWTSADKMTKTQLAAADTFGTDSISTPYGDQTVTYSNNANLRDKIEYLISFGSSSSAYYLRPYLADWRAEIGSAPNGTNYASVSQGKLYVEFDPPPNAWPMELGVIA